MKKLFWLFAIMLLCTVCASPQQGTSPVMALTAFSPQITVSAAIATDSVPNAWEDFLNSYYAAQEGPVFAYIQKNRIRRFMTEHWTPGALTGIQNQQWNFDCFAEYVILDEAGTAISDNLYYCPFSADNNRYGFIVVKYFKDGPAVQNQGVTETDYLYDLQALTKRVSKAMDEAGVDLSEATATRGRLGSDEIILFTVNDGGRYACNLTTLEVVSL